MSPQHRPSLGRHPHKTAMRHGGAGDDRGSISSIGSLGSFGSSDEGGLGARDSPSGTPRKAAAKRVAYAQLHWDDLPAWRRDNAFILTGYRPTSHSYAASLASVLGVHNESVNIWTHLAGAVVAALLGLALYVEAGDWLARAEAAAVAAREAARDALPGVIAKLSTLPGLSRLSELSELSELSAFSLSSLPLPPRPALPALLADVARIQPDASSTLVLTCFAGGAVACLGMSATYHALCNHSPAVARWGNKLDYSGIVFLIVGSYVPTLYYGFFCHPRWLTLYMYLIILLGLACLAVSWLEHFRTPAWRPYRALLFVGLGASGVVPIVHDLLLLEYVDGTDADNSLAARYSRLNARMGLNCVLLQGVLYVTGAFLYAARWPERWRPGRFDIWGSSHQIFHVFVLMAAAVHLRGVLQAYLHHHNVMGAQCTVPPLR